MKSILLPACLCAALLSPRLVIAAAPPVSEVVPCLAYTGDWQPIAANTPFPAAGKSMFVVFHLAPNEKIATLVAKWIAVDVGNAAPPNHEITQASFDLNGQQAGAFTYTQTGPLPVGKYRVDVTADGKPWKSVEITVVKGMLLSVKTPGELVPLIEGRIWTYDFVQEAGPGVTLTMPGVTPDAQGRLHATVTITVGQTGEKGTHLSIARNGEIVTEEWWRLDGQGLKATQRKAGDETLVLDPPQVLLAMAADPTQEWIYAPADGSYQQRSRLWCMNADAAPGIPRGWLVVTEQEGGTGIKLTVERHFMLGIGLVREVITTTMNGNLLSRQMMTLHPSG